MKVLVLKAPKESLDDVDPYVEALQNFGVDAEGLHVLSFHYINEDNLKHKLLSPETFGGFVFTSPRSVIAVTRCIQDISTFNKTKWSALPSYVVGEGTAKVLREKLGWTGIGQESGSAQQLAQFIIEGAGGRSCKPLLFPCADMKRNLLQDTLTEAGIIVDSVTSYRTIPNPHLNLLLREKFNNRDAKPCVLIFFSPSGVNAVLPHLAKMDINLESCKMIAIGPTTESALREHGVGVSATAEKPSPAGLVQAVKILQHSPKMNQN